MALIINGITYPKVLQGDIVKKSLDGALFTVTVSFVEKAKQTSIKKFDFATYEGTIYFVSYINISLSGSYYRHTLVLSELTLLLEKYIMPCCSFTNETDRLLHQVEKMFYKVEPIRTGEIPRFFLTAPLRNMLANIPGEDFIYHERLTLREMLDDMLAGLGIRAYVESVNEDWSYIQIGYLDLNRKSEDIKTLNYIVSAEDIDSAEYYANEFDISLTNAQSKEKIKVYQDWQTLKPISIAGLDDSNLKLQVNSPIEELDKVLIKYLATVNYYKDGTTQDPIYDYPIRIDITDLFIEREIYEILSLTEQNKYIPYEKATKEIGTFETYRTGFFTISKLLTYISSVVVDIVKQELERTHGGNITNVSVSNPTKEGSLFHVSYIPYFHFDFKQSKDNPGINKKITSVLNQTERNVDIDRFSKSIRTLANIVGNKELIREVDINSESELLELGDRIADGFSLFSYEYVRHNANLRVMYKFMQHYEVNTNARLSRERRLFDIPMNDLVHRTVLIKDKLLISTSAINGTNNSLLTDNTLKDIIKSLDKTNLGINISHILFSTRDKATHDYPNNGKYALNMVGAQIGKSLIVQANTYDNYSVGLSSGKRIIGGREVYLNPYVDDLGEIEILDFDLVWAAFEVAPTFEKKLELGSNIPLVKTEFISSNIVKNYTSIPFEFGYRIKKDRLETLNIVYQLEAEQLSNVIVGNYFMKYLWHLNEFRKADLRVWINPNGYYKSTDTEFCKGQLANTAISITIDFENYRIWTNYSVENLKSWAIGTADGELIFAVNNDNQPLNTISFGLKKG